MRKDEKEKLEAELESASVEAAMAAMTNGGSEDEARAELAHDKMHAVEEELADMAMLYQVKCRKQEAGGSRTHGAGN